MTYSRKLYTVDFTGTPEQEDDGDKYVTREIIETFEQPPIDRARYLAFHAFDTVLNRRPFKYLLRAADAIGARIHARTCDNDCDVAIMINEDEETTTEPWCGRMSLDARMDCYCYSLEYRNNTNKMRL